MGRDLSEVKRALTREELTFAVRVDTTQDSDLLRARAAAIGARLGVGSRRPVQS